MNIKDAIKSKILILDGAFGTEVQALGLGADDFGGENLVGCNENLVFSNPDVVLGIHEGYLRAGADIIETDTFGATPLVLAEYGLADKAYDINVKAGQLARAVSDDYQMIRKCFVAGSMGPTNKSLFVAPDGVSFDELADSYYVQACGLIDGDVDYLLLETQMDTLNIKASYIGILKAFAEKKKELPIAVSVTLESNNRMLAGQNIEALYASIKHIKPLYIGLNCSTGPIQMKDNLIKLANISEFPIAIVPNAGMPTETGTYDLMPDDFVAVLRSYAEKGLANVIGGCCGTTAEYIEKLKIAVKEIAPRKIDKKNYKTLISGMNILNLKDNQRPYLIGERANVIGSRIFKNLIMEGKFDEAGDVAVKQARSGAHIVDICLTNPDREVVTDMVDFLNVSIKRLKVPIMIDSQDFDVLEVALKHIQGRCVINSVNLEQNGALIQKIVPLAKKYGAMLVVGCVGNKVARTVQEKLEIAEQAYNKLVNQYGIEESDLIFDPLVFPIASGDENYLGSAQDTLEGVRELKKKYPNSYTVLGISNISFGLPLVSREVLNSFYLYEAVKYGLDMAIINTEKLILEKNINEQEKRVCKDLIYAKKEHFSEKLQSFIDFFRKKEPRKFVSQNLTINAEERLKNAIISGSKVDIEKFLEELLIEKQALDIINGPLIEAMDKVGRLFFENDLIITEVLQSAEVMKLAIDYLKPRLPEDSSNKGTLLLATVKGDVHDIGKNLVKIIFSSNGYKVIDLGINIEAQKIVDACKKYKPSFIGLSGLLVQSSLEMVKVAKLLNVNNISIPIILGGAALTEAFVKGRVAPIYEGRVFYSKDALEGLMLVQHS